MRLGALLLVILVGASTINCQAANLFVFEDSKRVVILAGERLPEYQKRDIQLSRSWPVNVKEGQLFMPEGLLLRVKTRHDFNTAEVKVNEEREVEICDDVYVNGQRFIDSGSLATVFISELLPPDNWAKDAAITIQGLSLETENGVKVPLKLDFYRTGIRESVIVTYAVVGIAALFIRGRNITVPAGTEFYLEVSADTDLQTVKL